MRFPALHHTKRGKEDGVSTGVDKGGHGHVLRIDVLRAVAILLVFTSHFYVAVFSIPNTYVWNGSWFDWGDHPGLVSKILRLTVFNGHLGVCLFFVISGLCIRLSDLARGSFAVLPFYARRFWRIYPPYLLVLVLTLLIVYKMGAISTGNLLAHLFMVHNFSPAYYESINGPFWSLALEVQCYLLYPLLLLACARFGRWWTGFTLAGLSCLGNVIGGQTFIHALSLPASFSIFRQMPTVLWFTWYVGFLLAERLRKGDRLNPVYLLALFPLGALWVLSCCYRPLTLLNEPVAGLILGLAVYAYLGLESPLGGIERAATSLGVCSYSCYLIFDQFIHPCIHALGSVHQLSPALFFIPGFLFTGLVIFTLGRISYQFVEKPSIRMGKRLEEAVLGSGRKSSSTDTSSAISS